VLTAEQQKHFELAAMDRALYSKLNKGEPGVALRPMPACLTVRHHAQPGETPDHSPYPLATSPSA